MDINTVIIYLSCLIILFIIGRVFYLPLKHIFKLLLNSVLGRSIDIHSKSSWKLFWVPYRVEYWYGTICWFTWNTRGCCTYIDYFVNVKIQFVHHKINLEKEIFYSVVECAVWRSHLLSYSKPKRQQTNEGINIFFLSVGHPMHKLNPFFANKNAN